MNNNYKITFRNKATGQLHISETVGNSPEDAVSWFSQSITERYEVVGAEEIKADNAPRCHYCGMKATSFGFFDEPVCPECGG